MPRKKLHEEFLFELAGKNQHYSNGEFTVIGEYKSAAMPILCTCRVHGEWDVAPTLLLRGVGCPRCAGRRRSHSDFIAELKNRNEKFASGKFQIIGTYEKASSHIACRCCVCGNEWNPTAHDLLSGKGCAVCAGVVKKTPESFRSELEMKNAKYRNHEFTLTTDYVNARTSVTCSCNTCGYSWSTVPQVLLSGSGCPHCAGKDISSSDFLNMLQLKNKHYVDGEFILVGNFEGLLGKIECRCLRCNGTWFPTAKGLLAGHSCPTCGGSLKITHEEFLQNLRKRNPHYANGEFAVIEEYQSTATQITCKCNQCGRTWTTTPNSLYRGTGCRKCSRAAASKRRQKTHAQFLIEIRNVNHHYREGRFEVLGKYDGLSKPVKCKCNRCGKEWSPLASSLCKSGAGCPRCAGRVFDQEDFIGKLRLKNAAYASDQFEVMSTYQGVKESISCRCMICDSVWTTSAGSLLSGSSCPECAKKRISEAQLMTHDEFIKRFHEANPHSDSIRLIGSYRGYKECIECECLRCGHHWEPQAGSLISGTGCPLCARSGTSFMEQFILKSFRLALGEKNVQSREHTAIGYELDIFIPSLNLAIEPGSWFWHRNKIDEDRKKREHGVKVITIYDHMDEDVASPFSENFYRFSNDLGSEDNHETLKRLVIDLLRDASVAKSFSEEEWAAIERYAYSHSGAKTHEDFERELRILNSAYAKGEFMLVGEYVGALEHIGCHCNRCQNDWTTTPSKLLNNRSCPRCRGTAKKTQDEYIEQLKRNNKRFASGELEVIGIYKSALEPIECICHKCGKKWTPIAARILSGAGCPHCNGGTRKTHDEFMNDLIVKSKKYSEGKFTVCGRYEKSNIPILCKCNSCGHEWSPTPSSLLQGTGCPLCAGKKPEHKQKRTPKSHDAFIKDLLQRNAEYAAGHFELQSEYTAARSPISCRCNICGSNWNTAASTLLSGSSCPSCKGGVGKRVICKETGIEFPSLAKAAKETGCTTAAIRQSIARNGTCGGYHWAFMS